MICSDGSTSLRSPTKLVVKCALCGRPVDQVIITENYMRLGWDVVVFYHGEEDRCFIAHEDIENAVDHEAVAFRKLPLPSPEDVGSGN